MPFPRWASIISAVLGSAVVSLGMVLQKKGVGWFGKKSGPEQKKESRRDRTAWLVGYGLNNSLVLFYFFALKALEPSIVGAMMGLNIVFTALFSRTILKEPLSKRVIAGSAILIACIAVANLSTRGDAVSRSAPFGMIAAFYLFPFLLVPLAFALRRFARFRGQSFAAMFALAAGCLEGVVIVLVKAMQHARGNDVLGYLTTPYLYAYYVATVAITGFMQVAYANARMTSVAPALWGAQIAYPVLIAYAAFSVPLVPVQLAAFAGVVACVVLIQSKR